MKKNTLNLLLSASALSLLVIGGCNKMPKGTMALSEPKLPATPYNYTLVQENGSDREISKMIHDGSNRQYEITDNTVTLGRVLFYDKVMSINNTVSCGSCHKQANAFSDNVNFSVGFGNKHTTRNSMAILNSVNNNNMFWDSRAASPLELSLMPVFNHLEMGMESDEMLVKKVSEKSYYTLLFRDAFGSTEVTKDKISIAIAHFVNALFSKQSKFDKEMANNFKGLTSMEKQGLDLFFSDKLKCNQCHAGTNFSAPDFPGGGYGGGGINNGTFVSPMGGFSSGPRGTANIGLDENYADNGRGNGQFKIPSLRNIALTAPYMHDGRFQTLDDVLNHYSHNIKPHSNLDPKFLDNDKPVRLNLSESDKFALKAFLNTLTDYNLITNKKFSDPFKN